MRKIELKANERKEIGKKSTKEIRKENLVPCIMYGGESVIHFQTEERSFKDLVYTPNVFLINVSIDGKSFKAVIKDIQFHPVTDRILHVDFLEVVDNKPINVKMPVELTGSALGIKEGGKLRFRRRWVQVRALADDIPESLVIDITNLDIGDSIHISDVEFPNVELIGPPRAMIVGVVSSRIAKGMEIEEIVPEVVEGEEGEEGVEGEEGAEGAEGAEGGAEGAEGKTEGKAEGGDKEAWDKKK